MGKTRKVSKGFSSGFVPDYRHAVEAVAESECLVTGKGSVLDMDSYDKSVVPIQTLQLSKISPFERRELGVRLKRELEQVRTFQRILSSSSFNGTIHQPFNSVQYQAKRPHRIESVPESASDLSMLDPRKKKPSVKRNGPRVRDAGSMAAGKNDPAKKGVSVNFAVLMKQCEVLLSRLMSQATAYLFNEPVDIVKHNIPDYFDVIKHPMDLGTVKTKLLSGHYATPLDFASDVRLTFRNAVTYNPVGHEVHVIALSLAKFFEFRWKTIEKKIPLVAVDQPVVSALGSIEEPEFADMPPAKKQKTSVMENNVKRETRKRVMTDADKEKLALELGSCLEDLPLDIINFLKENTPASSQAGEDEIEIDLDVFKDDTLYVLRELLDNYLLETKKKRAMSEACEIEIDKEPNSNISDQPFKGDDEDVDIVGNDLPPSAVVLPSMVDNSTSRNNSNRSSSKSSSSESGSSSSDSESSSDSDVDGGKNSTLDETVDARVEPKQIDQGDPSSGDHRNQNAESNSATNKQSSVEPNCLQEGESARPDQHVSPDKSYRAAQLIGRYADIIIKAQESKTADSAQPPDLGRLKLEKEELERRRKEEKARLQAEAKAAEESRRKAEAEAAAEAKRAREREREAARQALLKMERTVEINENSQFMEDLELFKVDRVEELESFKETASPENSPNDPLGSFNFRGSGNPLEQLGLYMKNDEEEDEEEEVEEHRESVPDISNDPEEGEID